MARVLIYEPHDDIAALLELVVRRLGHEPVTHDGREPEALGVQAAVIEPGEVEGINVARRLRALGVPILFASIFPAEKETLDLQPIAYLVKPFPIYALERALEAALGTSSTQRAVGL
jgi:hypothetical protein